MIKEYLFNFWSFFIGIIFIIPSIAVFSFIYTVSNTYAEETAVGEDKIKQILLGQKQLIMEWSCDNGYAGLDDLIFEDSGKKIIVKLNNPDYRVKCKRKVTITPNGLKMSGCRGNMVHMIFDPNDNIYPFKGDNQSCVYKFKIN